MKFLLLVFLQVKINQNEEGIFMYIYQYNNRL